MRDHNLSGPDLPGESTSSTPLHLPFDGAARGSKWQLKAIPTYYHGCWFRSRLEARWAVFFDYLEIEWRHEHEGFILSPMGKWYLPDFFLPELGYWVEIKPKYPDAEAQRKSCLFNYALAADDDPAKSRERAYIVHGDIPWPCPKEGNIIGYATDWKDGEDPAKEDRCWQMCPTCDQLMIGQINQMTCQDCMAELGTLLDDALESVPGIPVFDRMLDIVPDMVAAGVSTHFFRSGHKRPKLREAYAAARSARFEKGTSPPSKGLQDAS